MGFEDGCGVAAYDDEAGSLAVHGVDAAGDKLVLYGGVGDDDEFPRLEVDACGCRHPGAEKGLNLCVGELLLGEFAHAGPREDVVDDDGFGALRGGVVATHNGDADGGDGDRHGYRFLHKRECVWSEDKYILFRGELQIFGEDGCAVPSRLVVIVIAERVVLVIFLLPEQIVTAAVKNTFFLRVPSQNE